MFCICDGRKCDGFGRRRQWVGGWQRIRLTFPASRVSFAVYSRLRLFILQSGVIEFGKRT